MVIVVVVVEYNLVQWLEIFEPHPGQVTSDFLLQVPKYPD